MSVVFESKESWRRSRWEGRGGGVLEASQGRRTRIPGGEGVNVKNREQKSTIA